jgi:translocation protein SEC62
MANASIISKVHLTHPKLFRCLTIILFYCCPAFPGKAAVKALLSPGYGNLKNVPKITTEAEAMALLQQTLPYAFYLRVDRQQAQSSSKLLSFSQQQMFTPDGYFAWFYEGSQWPTYVGGVAMVAIMLAGVMFPLWPSTLRLGVWYLSILVLALIGVFLGIAAIRLIFYVITVLVTPPGIWIFPQLFADVGFVSADSSHPCGPNKLTRF